MPKNDQRRTPNRIDPSIPLADERDGQAFFDAAFPACLSAEAFDAIESLDYATAARLWRAIGAAQDAEATKAIRDRLDGPAVHRVIE